MTKALDLLDTIDEWRAADCDVADHGWTKDNEGRWDDAKGRLISLADELQKSPCKCVVVTISETIPTNGTEVDTVVSSDWDKANAWVGAQIESNIEAYDLDRESAVDGWCVELDDDGHTIQYEAKERLIQ